MTARPVVTLYLVALCAILTSCTSEALESAAASKPSPGSLPSAGEQVAASDIPAAKRLRLDPIVGTTMEAATPLARRLALQARAKGFAVTGSAEPAPALVVKGYFSALTEGPETTVVYVWDIYDLSGNRLHRISGQQKAPANGAEGWTGVSSATMEAVADATAEEIALWLNGRPAGKA